MFVSPPVANLIPPSLSGTPSSTIGRTHLFVLMTVFLALLWSGLALSFFQISTRFIPFTRSSISRVSYHHVVPPLLTYDIFYDDVLQVNSVMMYYRLVLWLCITGCYLYDSLYHLLRSGSGGAHIWCGICRHIPWIL